MVLHEGDFYANCVAYPFLEIKEAITGKTWDRPFTPFTDPIKSLDKDIAGLIEIGPHMLKK